MSDDVIWVLLFSVNDYDQPYQIYAWWKEKPSIQQMADDLNHPFTEAKDDVILNLVKVYRGESVQIIEGDCTYKLMTIREGELQI